MAPEQEDSSQPSQDSTTGPYSEPIETTPNPSANLLKIYYDSIIQSTPRSSKWSLSSSAMRATCPAHLILLDLICLMKFEGWAQNMLHSPVTSSLLGTNILLRTGSQTQSVVFP
jgi:hypothetical protein